MKILDLMLSCFDVLMPYSICIKPEVFTLTNLAGKPELGISSFIRPLIPGLLSPLIKTEALGAAKNISKEEADVSVTPAVSFTVSNTSSLLSSYL